jgi:lysozyme family protein
MGDLVEFEPAFALVNAHEGGYVFDPADRGGETYGGISRRYHGSWRGWSYIDWGNRDGNGLQLTPQMRDQLDQAKRDFYEQTYWNDLRLCELTRDRQLLANEIYDAAVNCGRRQATLWVQRALVATGVKTTRIDGIMGPRTVHALNQEPRWMTLLKMIEAQQGVHYMRLAIEDPLQQRFIYGWLKRVRLGA